MNNSKAVTLAHSLILGIKEKNVAVDATLGNGKDSLFLANHFNAIYGFDIQEVALKRSKERLTPFNNVKLILDSHINIKEYVTTKIDLVLFNLGYLPGSDKRITTNIHDVIRAIESITPLMNKASKIILVVYTKHNDNYDYPIIYEYLKINNLNFNLYEDLGTEKVIEIIF